MNNILSVSKKSLTYAPQALVTLVQESVRKVMSEELMKLRASLVPWASPAEQRDIEKRYGAPGRKEVAKTIDISL